MFDKEYFKKLGEIKNRYEKRINQLQDKGMVTDSIEIAVNKSIDNLNNEINSFVIYGEPQSGKTELMIALTARLLDEGKKIIVLLVNDNVQLLSQNLQRFKESGLDPAPYKYSEILDKNFKVSNDSELIVFCTKNTHNLQKLLQKIGDLKNKIIIDDEADYATPDSKINQEGDPTKINKLIKELKGDEGVFIGVTATPARLDLNNTFENRNTSWVQFPPHPKYTGQETFFPNNLQEIEYELELLPDEGDDPKYIRKALFNFFVNVAKINTLDYGREENFCMLVHTSGKKVDHSKDHNDIIKIFNILSDINHNQHDKYLEEIYKIAEEKYPGYEKKILEYIVINKNRKSIVIINSDGDKDNVDGATNPSTLFTIAIGGNIVSRGVTFNNLLCMFFTRDVKHKIQQDTYIQRARMFGARGKYLKYFMLFIPNKLFQDWHRAFIYHRFALESIKDGNGIIWLEDPRISAASTTSIDKVNIGFDTGEISYNLTEFSSLNTIIQNQKDLYGYEAFAQLESIHEKLGEFVLPKFLLNFIKSNPGSEKTIFVNPLSIDNFEMDRKNIIRKRKGLISDIVRDKPGYIHYFRVLYSKEFDTARVFYRYYNNEKIKFLKNRKHDS